MNLQQHSPPHPGELIFRTYIEPFETISASKIALELGVSRSTFNRLLTGKSDLSPEMAIRLSAVLGRTPESWMALQESFDLYKARAVVDTSKMRRFNFAEVG